MRYLFQPVSVLCLFLWAQCSTSHHDKANQPAKIDGYREPAFPNQERKRKLREVASIVDATYKSFAAANHFPALAYGVVMDGELVLSGASGFSDVTRQVKASAKSMFRIASMTKSFTAMAIVKLRDDGKLELDEPASKYIPELRNVLYLTDDAPQITIRHLLTMNAGFPEDNPWGDRQLADKPDELRRFIQHGISFSNVPAKEFEYSNMGYAMLGEIVTVVSGTPFQRYISEQLLAPLGMSNTRWEFSEVNADLLASGYRWENGQWIQEPLLHDGIYGAMGGLITTIEDFSKYVNFHLQAWPPRNGTDSGPVKRSSLREMHKPWQFRGLYSEEQAADKSPCPAVGGYGYGLGWRRNCEGLERVSHSGGLPGFGSEYRFYPELGLGIIAFANLTYASAGAVNSVVMDTIMTLQHLDHRLLPVSDTLNRRKEQVMALLKNWNGATEESPLERQILAENFYLDRSREDWVRDVVSLFAGIGTVVNVSGIIPENQLRGTFVISGKQGDAEIFFTLTPEQAPRIQQLDLRLRPRR